MISAGNISIELFAKINGKDIPVGTMTLPITMALGAKNADSTAVTATMTLGKPAE